ncbi:helix-turn-helix domain-containing protein [Streptomyces sp. DSM 44917]|uniref:Helix-turn-helix domain-containing protein n=1 Tax=Streptomyces boetiae TaxID=3075541 RepID=A0ABU2L3X0_9ACTN|nr:helix-turn-helix domain-containing protein [Streptomyces sp. DSM 44917]MDT0306116.1 helix-turn-helix domain-containing protein [Streptomyces sp. DSM 44917]
MAQSPRPVTDADREAVRRLHAAGHGRNEIARRLKRSPRTISDIADALGLTFDRSATAVATEARKIDAKARRVALVHRAYTRAEKLYARLEADEAGGYLFTATTVNGIETERLNHVPGHEEKALATAIGQHLTHAAKLEAIDGNTGEQQARDLVSQLFDGLAAVYQQGAAAAGPGEGDGDAA